MAAAGIGVFRRERKISPSIKALLTSRALNSWFDMLASMPKLEDVSLVHLRRFSRLQN
jgi:hypothetical protein